MIKDIEVKELANVEKFSDILKDIKNLRHCYILEKNGEPQAALLSMEDLMQFDKLKLSKEQAWEALFESIKKIHAKNPAFDASEVDIDVDQAIRNVRNLKSES